MEKHIFDIKNQRNELKDIQNTKDNTVTVKKDQSNAQDDKIEEKNMLKFLDNKMKEMETQFDIEENLVIDLGSAYTKIGFSGEDLPRLVIPSIYASLKTDSNKKEINLEKNQYLYGYDVFADKDRFMYDVKYLQQGDHEKVIDEDFLNLLKEIINNKLSILPSDFNVIVNASPIKNKDNILALTRLFLDDLNFKGLSIINSCSLSLFSTGRTSGLVLDCGEKKTMCVPIYEGFPLYHAMNISNIGGINISDEFLKGIKEAKPEFNHENIACIREIKEKMCSVPYLKDSEFYLRNDKEDVIASEKKLYKLPDGEEIIEIPKKNRINAAEILFK